MARRLDEILKTDPYTAIVRLEYEDIADLTPLVPVLGVLSNLQEIDLRGNRLTSLPKDLSSLTKVTTLHLQQNQFKRASDVLAGLASMPSLAHLEITLPTEEEEEKVLLSLGGLQSLNGAALALDGDVEATPPTGGPPAGPPPPLPSGPIAPPAPPASTNGSRSATAPTPPPAPPAGVLRDIVLTEDDLEAVALLYGAINALCTARAPEAETENFETHIQTVLGTLSERLNGVEDTFTRQAEILTAKHNLYDICYDRCIALAGETSSQFSHVLSKLRDVHNGLFTELPGVMGDMRTHFTAAIDEMKAEVSKAHQETAQLLEAAEALEMEAAAHSEEKERLGLSFQKERQRLLSANKQLQQEAQNLAAKVKQYESGMLRAPASSSHSTPARGAGRGASSSPSPAPTPAAAPVGNAVVGNITVRNLSLKQIKEMISNIYASKVKFDQKCADAHLPRETMEQHMYTYLNQKYGLRSLIVEHASSIHRAVKRYSNVDNDVAVFGLVLNNEIDEEFRYVQKQLKETVADLLRVYLKGKFPLKTDDAINTLLEKRIDGHVYEEEWVDIIKYMYNHEDSLALIVMVNDLIQSTPAPPKPRGRRGKPEHDDAARGRVKFDSFLKVLLDFQLRGHQRFLQRFHQLFQEFDTDRNGVVNEGEFLQLVRSLDGTKTEDEADALVNMVDPYNNQHITYSECVAVLSSELVALMSGTHPGV